MWQRFYEKQKTNNFELISVAADVQGASVVKPFVQKFGVTFPVAVDSDDTFGRQFGLKVVPVSVFIDELGIIRLVGEGPSAEFLKKVEAILQEPISRLIPSASGAASSRERSEASESLGYTASGHLLLKQGQTNEALVKLRESLANDPSNWRIRKQIWAIENPDRFYSDASPDFDWQRKQIKKEEEEKPRP